MHNHLLNTSMTYVGLSSLDNEYVCKDKGVPAKPRTRNTNVFVVYCHGY